MRVFSQPWFIFVLIDEDPEHELGIRPIGCSRLSKTFILEQLPAKLDLNCWVSDTAMGLLSNRECMKEGLVLASIGKQPHDLAVKLITTFYHHVTM